MASTIIRQRREERGLTAFELGIRSKVHPSFISKVEKRRVVPGEVAKKALLKELGLSPEQAFDESGLAKQA